MKKILLISSSPIKNDGLTKIEQEIVSYNKDIHFDIAGKVEEKYSAEKFREYGCNVLELPGKKNIIQYMHAIKKCVLSDQYDAVYIHGNSAMMFFEAKPVYSLHKGIRIIAHCHNTKTKHPFFHHVLKSSFNKMLDVKIGCSKMAADWAFNEPDKYVIPNGIELEKYRSNNSQREKIRKELGWNNCHIVGHIGRFSEQKNHKFLIDLFKKISEKDDSYRLLLIGKGELSDSCNRQIISLGLKDKVKIIPFTDNVPAYLNAMDVMVLPSLYEGLCLVALEAQANGLPLITSDTMAEETYVTDDHEILSLTDSFDQWANKVMKYANHPHTDNVTILKGTSVDYDKMMLSVRSVLIKQLQRQDH